MGDIAKGVLYRSSSPVNNELGRALYSDNLINGTNVNTVINLVAKMLKNRPHSHCSKIIRFFSQTIRITKEAT